MAGTAKLADFAATCSVIVALLVAAPIATAGSDITEYWRESAASSQIEVDHSAWNELLDAYLVEAPDGLNRFRYGVVSAADKRLLEQYLEMLQSVTVTDLTSTQQYAYWINFYNALTIQVILEHYPVDSIFDISYSLLSRGPWKEKLVSVEGMELSLDDVEHEILRPIFRDNRIHYAVNCASYGCPNLQTKAFTVENLDELLEFSAMQYINHPRGVTIEDGELIVSSIYDWYADDFGKNEKEIIQHFLEYADDDLKGQLSKFDEIEDYRYDWALNDAYPAPQTSSQ